MHIVLNESRRALKDKKTQGVSPDPNPYPFPEMNPSFVPLNAWIIDGAVPTILGYDGIYYTGGVTIHFDDSWQPSNVPILITIENSSEWSLVGWTQTGDNTWQWTLCLPVIQNAVNIPNPSNLTTLPFAFHDHTTGALHDPAIIITRPT